MSRLTKQTLWVATGLVVAAPLTVSAQALDAGEIVPLTNWPQQELYDNGFGLDDFIDEMEVIDANGEQIGDIENVLVGTDGQVLSIIAEVGGFWDIGDTHVNIPWDEVEVDLAASQVTVPVTEETVDDYDVYPDEMIEETEATTETGPVDDDLIPGARVWRATELIGDYARLRDGEAYVNYGYVEDIIVRDGAVMAVLVRPRVSWGTPGTYGYPFYGYGYGWEPGQPYYDLPYLRGDIEPLEPVDGDATE